MVSGYLMDKPIWFAFLVLTFRLRFSLPHGVLRCHAFSLPHFTLTVHCPFVGIQILHDFANTKYHQEWVDQHPSKAYSAHASWMFRRVVMCFDSSQLARCGSTFSPQDWLQHSPERLRGCLSQVGLGRFAAEML